MKHRIVVLVFVLLVAGSKSHAGGFSKLPISARTVTLGGSLVSFADDPNVLFSNPAGIASLNSLTIATSYTQLFSGITDDQIGYVSGSAVANLGFVGNLGIGLKSFSSNAWKENELVGTYGQELFEFLSVGGSVKLLHWSTPPPTGRHAVPEEGMSNVTLSFDVGAQSLIRDIVPENDVRFGVFFGDVTQPSIAKNGSDVTAAAIRIARAYTGRDFVAACGYHGWHDWYIGSTSRNLGVPKETQKLTLRFKYNDIDSLKKIFQVYKDKIACVIMEAVEFEPPEKFFLEAVKDIAYANEAILIFDEVIMGFRLALAGAQEYYKVIPDMACFGKGIANGMPLSVLCGSAKIMELFREVFFSTTFAAETLSLAAAKATINVYKREPVIAHIAKIGASIKSKLG